MSKKSPSYLLWTINHRRRFSNYGYQTCISTTEENGDVTIDFYSRLETLYDSLLRNKVKILFGYLNTQIGNKSLYRETTGRYSF